MSEQELRAKILEHLREAYRLSHSAYKNGRKPVLGSRTLIIVRRHLTPCIKDLMEHFVEEAKNDVD